MLNIKEKKRYSRHILLDGFTEESQEILKNSKVLVIGAGGLGSPLLLYLASAGIGTIGIFDFDFVSLDNLQRQVIHTESNINVNKAISAKERIRSINSEINIITYTDPFNINSGDIVSQYDLIAVTVDDLATRYLINEFAIKHKKIQVTSGVVAFEGWITTFNPNKINSPCYACLHKKEGNIVKKAKDIGVLAPLVGTLGSMQGTEVIRELLHNANSLVGIVRIINTRDNSIVDYKLNKRRNCEYH